MGITNTRLANFSKLNPIFFGSFVVMGGSFMVNILSYLFQLLAGRLLGVSDYGILVALFSLFSIFSVLTGILNTSVVKVVSELKAKDKTDDIASLFLDLFKLLSILCALLLLIGLLFSSRILRFLNFDNYFALAYFALFFIVSTLTFIPLSILQGLQKFVKFSVLNLTIAVNKLIFGIGLTLLTFHITATILGMFLGAIISLGLAVKLCKDSLDFKNYKGADTTVLKVMRFAFPSSLTLVALTLLFNVDVVLVKHFFVEEVSGIYSSLAIIGRILFFGVSSIALVLFPISAETHSRGEKTGKVFGQSLLVCVVLLSGGLLIFSLFPKEVVLLLFGKAYVSAIPFLSKFALFMFFYTLVYMFAQYFLSIHKTKVGIPLILGAFAETALIWFRHNGITQVLDNLVSVNIILFLVLVCYFGYGFIRHSPLLQARENN